MNNGFEILVVGALLLSGILHAGVGLVLWAWGRWVARRHPGTFWRYLSAIPLVGLVLGEVGFGSQALLVARVFADVGAAAGFDKLDAFFDFVGRAMDVATAFLVPESLLIALSLVLFGVGSALKPSLADVRGTAAVPGAKNRQARPGPQA